MTNTRLCSALSTMVTLSVQTTIPKIPSPLFRTHLWNHKIILRFSRSKYTSHPPFPPLHLPRCCRCTRLAINLLRTILFLTCAHFHFWINPLGLRLRTRCPLLYPNNKNNKNLLANLLLWMPLAAPAPPSSRTPASFILGSQLIKLL